MQTPRRATRSSVLGKRSHQLSSPPSICQPTPEHTPSAKRARVLTTLFNGDSNKENIPPFRRPNDQSPPTTPRAARALRRANTEYATPSRSRTRLQRHTSASQLTLPTHATGTPSALSRLTLSTPPPSPSASLVPIHSRARALLRSTCNSTAHVAERDEERVCIQEFLANFLRPSTDINHDTQTLYISGLPGTGKTVLINSILRDLDVEFPGVRIISINCMALNGIDTLWDRLLEQLEASPKRKNARRSTKVKGRDAVDDLLSSMSSKCVLLLDELDHVATTQRSLVAIFSLAQAHPSTLRVIGIANVHTLTASVPELSMHGVTGVATLHFAPYTSPQLLTILQTRLGDLRDQSKAFLSMPTLTLLTKKVASLTGDVRTLFEVLRVAIDLAVASETGDLLNASSPTVTPTHILTALKAYKPAATTRSSPTTGTVAGATNCSNEIVTKVRNLGFQARLVLLSLLLATQRLEAGLTLLSSTPLPSKSPVKRTQSASSAAGSPPGGANVDLTQLHAYYTVILNRVDNETVTPVSRSEFSDLTGVLETVGLITISSSASTPRPASPSKTGRRSLCRTTSFVGSSGKGKEKGQEVDMAESVRSDDILRGIGIVGSVKTEGGDIREEEVRTIWNREKARLKKEIPTKTRSGGPVPEDVFNDAMQD